MHPRTPSLEDQRDAVYKIVADIEYNAGTEDAPALQHTGWSGTAWVAERHGGRSFLMTAGHVCETSSTLTLETFFGPPMVVPILSVKYSLRASDGTVVEGARPILDDDTLDLCELAVQGDLGDSLPLADADPEYGSHVTVIGAPQGLWGAGVAPIIDLTFSGRGGLFGGNDGLYFVGLGDHGNSGSAIVQDGKAVALLNLGTARYTRLIAGVPWDVLRSFEDRAMHRPG